LNAAIRILIGLLADDFKTIQGKEYKNVTVRRIEPDGIVLTTNFGISKVYFVELPKEIQEKFHYDQAKAAAYSSEQAGVVDQSPLNQQPASVAKLGETRLSIEALLGKPPQEGPDCHDLCTSCVYTDGNWNYILSYIDDMCATAIYQKVNNSLIMPDEWKQLLLRNAQGYEWISQPRDSQRWERYLRSDKRHSAHFDGRILAILRERDRTPSEELHVETLKTEIEALLLEQMQIEHQYTEASRRQTFGHAAEYPPRRDEVPKLIEAKRHELRELSFGSFDIPSRFSKDEF
jgi:hypothetical protein